MLLATELQILKINIERKENGRDQNKNPVPKQIITHVEMV